MRFKKNKKVSLKWFGIAMGILHGISFVVFLTLSIYYNNNIGSVPLTSDFSYFDNGVIPKLEYLTSYKLIWVLLAFPLITSAFHLYISILVYKDYKKNLLMRGIQVYRWIEYSITASLMTWVIWALSGGTNIFVGLGLVFLNINMNLFGYISELLNATPIENEVNIKKKLDRTSSYHDLYVYFFNENYSSSKKVIYWPIVIAFLNFGIIWGVILSYFFKTVATNSSNVPWWVWTIDIGLLIQFLNFGLVMLFHYISKDIIINGCRKNDGILINMMNTNKQQYQKSQTKASLLDDKKIEPGETLIGKNNGFLVFFASRYNYELTYQILSLTSKLFLTWFLYAGLSRP
jgi:hypothetical protein